jgi:MFS family permease
VTIETILKKKRTIMLVLLVLAVLVRVFFGVVKNDYHCDEGITLALTNGTWPVHVATDHRLVWMDMGELSHRMFDSRLERGKVDYDTLTEATARDVHPPLYYWLLFDARRIIGPSNHHLASITLNMLFFLVSCFFFIGIVSRIWKDTRILFLAFILFAFSSATISLTVYMRMYELLQMVCLGFLYSAVLVCFPDGDRKPLPVLITGIAGLMVFSFMGLMTQYYFLLFIVPVCVFAFFYLLITKRPAALLWSMLVVLAGLYVALRLFPPMIDHLTKSQRAGQSIANLTTKTTLSKLESIWMYIRLLSRNLVPLAVPVVAAGLAVFQQIRGRIEGNGSADESEKPGRNTVPFMILMVLIFLFTFTIISISAPYQTVRYFAAFIPAYALTFVSVILVLLRYRSALVLLAASAVLVFVYGVLPGNMNVFHEDYPVPEERSYLTDDIPLMIIGTPWGYTWKNMVPYLNIPHDKRVYVMEQESVNLYAIARESGSPVVYALVDDYLPETTEYEHISYYAFFHVYKVTVE